MQILLLSALYLTLSLNCEACLDLGKPTTVHIQNYDGPIYLIPSPKCSNDFQQFYINNNNPSTTVDDGCDCVTKQLSSCVPINCTPQSSGTCCNRRTNCNKCKTPCHNNVLETSCSSTNCYNYGTGYNSVRPIYNTDGSYDCYGTCCNDARTTCNNDDTICNNFGTNCNNLFVPMYENGGSPVVAYGILKKSSSPCPKCGCLI